MLDKFKQLGKLKAMQDEMKEEKFTVENHGIKITINGNLIVEEVVLEETNITGEAIRDSINETIKKAQGAMAQKMMGMGF